jgi:hypothetical protein
LIETFSRGQVNALLLLCIAGMVFLLTRGWRFAGGMCLGVAVCIKLFPAFLLVYPLWKRDARCVAGCALMMLLGLGLLPALVFGPERTVTYYGELAHAVLGPGLGTNNDASRNYELLSLRNNYSQSFAALLHNLRYPVRDTRPEQPELFVRLAHWSLAVTLTLLTLAAASRRKRLDLDAPDPIALVLTFAQLTLLLPLITPIAHGHYFALALPVFVVLFYLDRRRTGRLVLSRRMQALLVGYLIATLLPASGLFEVLRDGLTGWASLCVWGIGLVTLWSWQSTSVPEEAEVVSHQRRAA